jgi:hypothetical protein
MAAPRSARGCHAADPRAEVSVATPCHRQPARIHDPVDLLLPGRHKLDVIKRPGSAAVTDGRDIGLGLLGHDIGAFGQQVADLRRTCPVGTWPVFSDAAERGVVHRPSPPAKTAKWK